MLPLARIGEVKNSTYSFQNRKRKKKKRNESVEIWFMRLCKTVNKEIQFEIEGILFLFFLFFSLKQWNEDKGFRTLSDNWLTFSHTLKIHAIVYLDNIHTLTRGEEELNKYLSNALRYNQDTNFWAEYSWFNFTVFLLLHKLPLQCR